MASMPVRIGTLQTHPGRIRMQNFGRLKESFSCFRAFAVQFYENAYSLNLTIFRSPRQCIDQISVPSVARRSFGCTGIPGLAAAFATVVRDV